MEKDLETFTHLLANPYFCKKNNDLKKPNEDNILLKSLQDKFPLLNITEKEYNQNILKIEILLKESIIKNTIDSIIEKIKLS